MNKTLWIIANWKSNKTLGEAISWIEEVGPNLEKRENIKVVVCPSFLDLEEVKKAVLVGNYPITVGSQDLSPFDTGPHTGEEAARLLKEVVDFAIIGHSERRETGETDQAITQKVKQAADNAIIPLVCVQGKDGTVPEHTQLIAYEPISAIGTGNPDTPQNAQEVCHSLKERYQLELLYGGSVTSENVKAYLQQDDISGVLIGTASLDPNEFLKIVQVAYRV